MKRLIARRSILLLCLILGFSAAALIPSQSRAYQVKDEYRSELISQLDNKQLDETDPSLSEFPSIDGFELPGGDNIERLSEGELNETDPPPLGLPDMDNIDIPEADELARDVETITSLDEDDSGTLREIHAFLQQYMEPKVIEAEFDRIVEVPIGIEPDEAAELERLIEGLAAEELDLTEEQAADLAEEEEELDLTTTEYQPYLDIYWGSFDDLPTYNPEAPYANTFTRDDEDLLEAGVLEICAAHSISCEGEVWGVRISEGSLSVSLGAGNKSGGSPCGVAFGKQVYFGGEEK